MSESRQLALDLPHRPAHDREDFFVAPSNEDAVGWVDQWPEWPSCGLVLTGPSGAGKSHLCAVWQKQAGALRLLPEGIDAALPGIAADSGVAAVLIDDADGAKDEDLLHLFNIIAERNGALLLSVTQSPDLWSGRLPDLTSRLRTLPIADIKPPEDELIGAVMVKMFADRQLAVPPEVVTYIVARMERSFAAAGALVARIDQAALERQRGVTIPLVRDVMPEQDQS